MNAPPMAAPANDADLTWLFDVAESAIGWASSFDPLCAIAMSGLTDGSSSGRSPDGRMVRVVGKSAAGRPRAAAKLRALTEAWNALSSHDRAVLFAGYASHRVHPQHRKRLGNWPGVILVLPSVIAAYRAAGARIAANDARRRAAFPVEIRAGRSSHDVADGEAVSRSHAGTVAYRPGAAPPAIPTLLEWLTETNGPRIDSDALRCGASARARGEVCCAVHAAEDEVRRAWTNWNAVRVAALKQHGLLAYRATPRGFVFRREED